MNIETTYTVDNEASHVISRAVAGAAPQHRDLFGFLKELGQAVPFDTGWMPPGVRNIRQFGVHRMVTITLPPGIHLVRWGRSEHDHTDDRYRLAMPWRVVIAQYHDNNLLGARMFYSPEPINTPDQQLYHANLPNINCQGYNRNGVGWVCFYPEDTNNLTLGQNIARTIDRCGGEEGYNRNMDQIDGPSLYRSKNKPEYTHDKHAWEAKTEAEGLDWVLDNNLWIPVRVHDVDLQTEHYDGGIPLNLEMAMHGAAPYMYDEHPLNMVHKHERNLLEAEAVVRATFGHAFAQAGAADPKVPHVPNTIQLPIPPTSWCINCGGEFDTNTMHISPGDSSASQYLCSECYVESVTTCESCGLEQLKWSGSYGSLHGDSTTSYCSDCLDTFPKCDLCKVACRDTDELTDMLGKQICPTCADRRVETCRGCESVVFNDHHICEQMSCSKCGAGGYLLRNYRHAVAQGEQFELCKRCQSLWGVCEGCQQLLDRKTLKAKPTEIDGKLKWSLRCPSCVPTVEKTAQPQPTKAAVTKEMT